MDQDIAEHLSRSYGTQAPTVLEYTNLNQRLSLKYPYLESEIAYACDHEYACTVVDALARRTRLAFLDAKEAWNVTPRVIEIMASNLKWTRERQFKELKDTQEFLKTMGL